MKYLNKLIDWLIYVGTCVMSAGTAVVVFLWLCLEQIQIFKNEENQNDNR